MQIKITWLITGTFTKGWFAGAEYEEEKFHICDLTEANEHIKELLDNGFKVAVEPYYGDEE